MMTGTGSRVAESVSCLDVVQTKHCEGSYAPALHRVFSMTYETRPDQRTKYVQVYHTILHVRYKVGYEILHL
jgi:hypothetical protein